MITLATLTLISWVVLVIALWAGGGTTKGFHVLVPALLSIALAIAVLL